MAGIETAQLPQLINYYRNCYREDSYDLSISNVDKLGKDRYIPMVDEDVLASAALPRYPVVDPQVTRMREQADAYRKERLLIYGCLMVKGRLKVNGGFSEHRHIHSPLFYFPASFEADEALFARIDNSELRINAVLLRQLLKPEVDTDILETFPEVSWPLTPHMVNQTAAWLQEHTLLRNRESLIRWPKLVEEPQPKPEHLSIHSACCLVLAERSRGSRGVLHELKELCQPVRFSSAIKALLAQNSANHPVTASQPNTLPKLLSAAQIESLKNAAQLPLSLVCGPPGTGKSFTIAAMAIDRMLQGESVLIVSKSVQAVDVVTDKLKADFGLHSGYVHAFEQNFSKTMKSYLDGLLKEGVGELPPLEALCSELKQADNTLRTKEKQFQRMLRVVKSVDRFSPWYKRIAAKLLLAQQDVEQLWSSQREIGQLQAQFEQRARDYINGYRTTVLHNALEKDRTELVKFNKGLRARNSKTFEERLESVDFAAMLKAFPVWLVTIDELNRVLPFRPELFDLVIVDEATQCDVASALPAIQRAKRAVVVGDGKQLRHVSFLARHKQSKLWLQTGLTGCTEEDYNYRDQSLLDLVSDALPSQNAVTLLDEHYRSKPELIAFSNQHFYARRLKIMQARPTVRHESALQFIKVKGSRTAVGRNSEEKDAVLNKIKELMNGAEALCVKPSIGVLSPYREQAQFLERAIHKAFTPQQIEDFKLLTATPFGFQGEERDVMLLSFAIDNQSVRASAYLNREDMFNVAITRARQQQFAFYSIDLNNLTQENLLRRYLNFCVDLAGPEQLVESRCHFAQGLSQLLEEQGVQTWIGYEVAGQEIDLLCQLDGSFIGIDLVGGSGEFEESFMLTAYKALYRAGIAVVPLPFFLWEKSQQKCVEFVLEQLDQSH